ncbi:cytochrome ubiquinol oxidase subunit I [Furfurilactobacillus curtus]|uniref:Cytochrome ubiquinol oxidase subunit I n=1 Tax=Furfurilactobacillus curtus TaxID=1746200 RepID=A0ABQ5JPH1_9LACO
MTIFGLSILSLARFQFAMTTVFHFFFVPFSIGMAVVVAIMETNYVIQKKEIYKKMTQFWGKIFLLSFAVGVVTGIIQEFQFGMNWSQYSRFMGDIFGAPLAIEALAAFFLESTFIGLWMFTWDRFKPVWHCLFIWLTALGSALSAVWILAANSFMQDPVGYALKTANGNTKAVMVSFADVVKNPQLWYELPHVLFGAFITAAFVIAGSSAWRLLKGKDVEFWRKSIKISLIVGLVAAVGVTAAGDQQTQYIIKNQPMKFAATEGIYKTTATHASWSVVEGMDTKGHQVKWSIEIPYVLSILSYHKTSGAVQGANPINKELHQKYDKKFGKDMNYFVPMRTLFYSFRVMAVSAGVFALVAILGLYFNRKKSDQIVRYRWFLYILGLCLWLPFIANTAGWFITELGRYPWVVYGLLTIADAVSPHVTAASLLFSNIIYFLLFAGMGAVMIVLSHRVLVSGPDADDLDPSYVEDDDDDSQTTVDPYAKGAFNHE